jgi:RNA polymerase sigma-70 factor (TIGR02943 family)
MSSEKSQIGAEAGPVPGGTRPNPATDPERWVEEYGDELFGYAAARVHDLSIAKDLVQETFLAGLRASHSFAGRSTERAWLFGILRKKLVDHYRLKGRDALLTGEDSSAPEEGKFFHPQGPRKDAWIAKLAPQAWESPDESLMRKEFQMVFRRCLAHMPERLAQAFLMRELDAVESEEICKDLDISPNNLWVMLHRARLSLRRCLEIHWFGLKETTDETD